MAHTAVNCFAREETNMYYIYSAIAGSVEIGIICWAITHGMSPAEIIGFGVAYQLGNLVPVPYQPTRKDGIASVVGCIALSAHILFGKSLFLEPFLLTTLISATLQAIRGGCKEGTVRWKKRLCRVIGFASAFLYRDCLVLCLTVVILVLIIGLNKIPDNQRQLSIPKANRTMILHQMHYFSYSYIMLYLSYRSFGNLLLTISSFVISWFTYLAVEPVLSKHDNNRWKKYLCVGHIGLGVALLNIYVLVQYSEPAYLVLWWLSGLGGGTVFCIQSVETKKQKGSINQQMWSWSENIGHIMGCLLALLWVSTTGYVEGTIVFAAILAFATVWSVCRKG